jgi:hypothetical protein
VEYDLDFTHYHSGQAFNLILILPGSINLDPASIGRRMSERSRLRHINTVLAVPGSGLAQAIQFIEARASRQIVANAPDRPNASVGLDRPSSGAWG